MISHKVIIIQVGKKYILNFLNQNRIINKSNVVIQSHYQIQRGSSYT